MDSNAPTADKFEIAVMQKDASGNVIQRKVEGEELKKILEEGKVISGYRCPGILL